MEHRFQRNDLRSHISTAKKQDRCRYGINDIVYFLGPAARTRSQPACKQRLWVAYAIFCDTRTIGVSGEADGELWDPVFAEQGGGENMGFLLADSTYAFAIPRAIY